MPDSDACMYIGFQIIYGIGRGLSMSTVSKQICSTPYCSVFSLPLPPTRESCVLSANQTPCFFQPFVAVQNSLSKKLIPSAMSMLMFSGNFFGAVAVVICQTVYTNSLAELIPAYAPDVDPQVVINAGATKVRDVVSPNQLPEVMTAYAKSIDNIWYLDCGLAAVVFVFGWFLGFQDIRKKMDVRKSRISLK